MARAERAGRAAAVVITGSAGERPLAEASPAAPGCRPDAVLAGRTDLRALAAAVAAAARVFCGDTGVAHLATALGTPSVVLFGPTPPAEWGPPADRPQHVALHHGGRGDPHADAPGSRPAGDHRRRGPAAPPRDPRRPRVGPRMGITDKISGKVKQAAGDLTGDESKRQEGLLEERKGEAKDELSAADERAQREGRRGRRPRAAHLTARRRSSCDASPPPAGSRASGAAAGACERGPASLASPSAARVRKRHGDLRSAGLGLSRGRTARGDARRRLELW